MYSTLLAAAVLLPLALAAPATSKMHKHKPKHAQTPTGYTGDITYYDVGLGSCGYTNTDAEDVVALALPMMQNGANPNNNPICGQMITIESADGSQHTAKVVDSCYACAFPDVDMSPTLFQKVAPTGDGRVHNVHWWFNSTPDGERPS